MHLFGKNRKNAYEGIRGDKEYAVLGKCGN